jgi:hypothetical protein
VPVKFVIVIVIIIAVPVPAIVGPTIMMGSTATFSAGVFLMYLTQLTEQATIRCETLKAGFVELLQLVVIVKKLVHSWCLLSLKGLER